MILIDRTLAYLENVAVKVAADLAAGTLKVNRTKSFQSRLLALALKLGPVKNQIFKKAKGQVMKQTNGLYPAPLRVCAVNVFLGMLTQVQDSEREMKVLVSCNTSFL
jgi:hypothetical protein